MKETLQNYNLHETRKSKKKKIRFWIIISSLSVIFLIMVFIVKAVISWSGLNVSGVNFLNQTNIANSSLLSYLEKDMMRNKLRAVFGPENILFWSLGHKPNYLYDLPSVKNLNVGLNLFRRTISIEASPRTPYGVVCEATSTSCFVFDDQGVIFSSSPSVQGPLILSINDFTGRHFILGESILPDKSWFENLINTLKIMKQNDFSVSEIDIDDLSLREWRIKTMTGPDFYFSFNFIPDNLSYILSNLSSRMNFSKISYVDFRVPERIYYK